MVGIYKITNPDKKVYIGRSQNVFKRFRCYKSTGGKGQPNLYESFSKHGIENHIFEVICECEIIDLKSFEIYFIIKYNSIEDGLNRSGNYEFFNPNNIPDEISINYCSSNMIKREEKLIIRKCKKIDGKVRSIICTDSQYKEIRSFLIKIRHRDKTKTNI